MLETLETLVSLASLVWNIWSDTSAEEARIAAEEARIAAEEAAMWRSVFWIAVIVIAVLAFIIWKKHRITAGETAKEPEEL